MQIVIDIPKEAYEIIKKDTESEMYIIQVIKQGIPLSENRGRLIDADEDIAKDGTLTVRVADGRKVTRVLVCGDNHFGGLYYPDEDAEPKTGHWISHYDEDAKEGWYECDRCHTERAFNTDYCPDCGAKMVEPQERSE